MVVARAAKLGIALWVNTIVTKLNKGIVVKGFCVTENENQDIIVMTLSVIIATKLTSSREDRTVKGVCL